MRNKGKIENPNISKLKGKIKRYKAPSANKLFYWACTFWQMSCDVCREDFCVKTVLD